eukprot:scaffold638535_cov15-Prasinocladus_malaysianus.AAC.1
MQVEIAEARNQSRGHVVIGPPHDNQDGFMRPGTRQQSVLNYADNTIQIGGQRQLVHQVVC